MLFTREQLVGIYYLLIGVVVLLLTPLLLASTQGDDSDYNYTYGGAVADTLYRGDYDLDDTLFNPPTLFERRNTKAGAVKVRKAEIPRIVELNRADSVDLISLRGVGGYYASKIIDYRNRLGGYFDIRQLRELNLTYFNLDSMSRYLCVDTSLIVKRHIGDYTFKNLIRHPYLDYETLVLIFEYKRELRADDTLTIKKLSAAGILRSTQAKKLSYYFY